MILNKRGDQVRVTTGEIFNKYKELCRNLGVGEVTQRRVSEIISELDMLGIINARIVSFGRYGRTKIIRLAVSPKSIIEGISTDLSISPLLESISREYLQ